MPCTQTSYWQSILERGRRWRLGGCLEWTVGLWADVHFQGHRSPGRSHPAPSSVRVIERGDGWPFCRPNKDKFPANGSEPFGNDRHLEPATTCPPSCQRRPPQLNQQEALGRLRFQTNRGVGNHVDIPCEAWGRSNGGHLAAKNLSRWPKAGIC